LHNRFDGLIQCEQRQLYVGVEDPSIMVLLEPGTAKVAHSLWLWGDLSQLLLACGRNAISIPVYRQIMP